MTRMPVIVLGGSDRRASTVLPEEGRDKHPIVGYKGAEIRVGGRAIVAHLLERLAATRAFSAIRVAGPRRVYERFVEPERMIDTDGSFGENIRVALETVLGESRTAPPAVAFTTCDILPEPERMARLMESWEPSDLWCPLVRAPHEPEHLGASAWKPAYRIRPSANEAPVRVLPGHLVVVDPQALRLNFVYRLFELGYRTRNQSIPERRWTMIRGVLVELLGQDLRHLFVGRAPNLTWSVLAAGLPAAKKLKDGEVTRQELEDALRRIFVTRRHRRRHPDRRVLLPFVDAIEMALDVDTEEEARALGAEFRQLSARS